MQIASDSQQNVPTFFTSFLLKTWNHWIIKISPLETANLPTQQGPGEGELPVLQVRIVFTNCRYCNKPPQNQPIYYYWVSRRNPKAKLQKESIEFHSQEDNAKAQNLNKSEWTKKWVPFIFIPPSRCKLTKSSFNLKIQNESISSCFQMELNRYRKPLVKKSIQTKQQYSYDIGNFIVKVPNLTHSHTKKQKKQKTS